MLQMLRVLQPNSTFSLSLYSLSPPFLAVFLSLFVHIVILSGFSVLFDLSLNQPYLTIGCSGFFPSYSSGHVAFPQATVSLSSG